MMNTTINGNSQYKDFFIMDCYSGSDAGGAVAFGINRESLGVYIMRSTFERTSWVESAELLGTHNYTTYTVTKTGAGATGTWDISITGSATSAGTSQKLQIQDVRSEIRTPNYFGERRLTAWFNNTGTPDSDWYSGIHVKGWTNGYTSWELCSYSSTETNNNYNLYFRNGNNSSWGYWKTIIDSTNYESIIVGKSETGGSDFTDGTQLLTSYASDSGFSTSGYTNKIYKRKASSMYNYIKTKLDSIYAPLNGVVPAGTIVMWGGSTAPSGWLLCNGSIVSRTTYSALFKAIGTTYGSGNGSTTFGLPNFKRRFPLGV